MAKEEITKISFRLSIEEKDKLVEYCEANDLNMSQVIRKAIREFLVQESGHKVDMSNVQ